jgi:hypothetical protein
VAGSVDRGSQATIEQWLITLEAVRRIGVAIYLVALALGLGAIITVLGFQTIRVRQLPNETTGQSQGVAHQHMGHCLYPVGCPAAPRSSRRRCRGAAGSRRATCCMREESAGGRS